MRLQYLWQFIKKINLSKQFILKLLIILTHWELWKCFLNVFLANCPDLTPTNGIANISASTDGQYMEGTTLSITCETGFVRAGPREITCQTSGSWSPQPLPTCQNIATFCLTPAIENGHASFPSGVLIGVGVEVTASCNSGFALVGADRFYCQEDGTYNPQPGTCLAGKYQLSLNLNDLHILCLLSRAELLLNSISE